jgi:hypothetical protein
MTKIFIRALGGIEIRHETFCGVLRRRKFRRAGKGREEIVK